MLVAAILVHVHFGFFMNWLGKEKGEGIEFDSIRFAGLGHRVSPHLTGGGAFSLDRVISAKFETAKLKN